MILTSFDPFVQEFDRWFGRLPQRAFGPGYYGSGAAMPMDAVRRPGEVELRFDLPGIDPESIQVTVDRGVLSVSAAREEQHSDEDQPFIRERVTGSFTRRVYLSDNLDTSAIEAGYDKGVLTVRVPVAESARPRKIEVRPVSGALTGSGNGHALEGHAA